MVDKSSVEPVTIEQQRRAWNDWNARVREVALNETSRRQADEIEKWLESAGVRDADILDAGCGTGWMAERLLRFGRVTGIDIADEIVARARVRVPRVNFIAGDIMTMDVPPASFDVVVSLEALAHVADQRALVAALARMLRPGGRLIVATQNRPVLERWSAIGAPIPGTVRKWVDARELRALLDPHFRVEELVSLVPVGDEGFIRIVNSPKLNRVVALALGEARVRRLKERALLGHTLLVRARPRR